MSTVAEQPTLVLGIGSPFGADRAGWEAIELLRRGKLEGVRFETSDRPGARLVTLLQGLHSAIIIDALACDAPPGTLLRIDPAALASGGRHSNHGFGVADALALGRVLGGLPPHLALIGISAAGDQVPPIDRVELRALVHAILQEKRARRG